MKKEICESCGSSNCKYDQEFGFWKCFNCRYVWAYTNNDPDYDDEIFCNACGGLGLNTKSIFAQECPACDGTGIRL